jgi:hypothetical protein
VSAVRLSEVLDLIEFEMTQRWVNPGLLLDALHAKVEDLGKRPLSALFDATPENATWVLNPPRPEVYRAWPDMSGRSTRRSGAYWYLVPKDWAERYGLEQHDTLPPR